MITSPQETAGEVKHSYVIIIAMVDSQHPARDMIHPQVHVTQFLSSLDSDRMQGSKQG